MSKSNSCVYKSDLKGRIRFECVELHSNPGLRRHCKSTLISNHWIIGFRLNTFTGSLVIQFDEKHRSRIPGLIEICLTEPSQDASIETLLKSEEFNARWQLTLSESSLFKRLACCTTILVAEIILPIPAGIMAMGALVVAFPIICSTFKDIYKILINKNDSFSIEDLRESIYASLLLSYGLPAEYILDCTLNDANEIVRSFASGSDQTFIFEDLLLRIGHAHEYNLDQVNQSKVKLIDISKGQIFKVSAGQHIFVDGEVHSGKILVFVAISYGSYFPKTLVKGDSVQMGSFVVEGTASIVASISFIDEPVFDFPVENKPANDALQCSHKFKSITENILDPFTLFSGIVFALAGNPHQSIAAFSFEPYKQWSFANTATGLTAITEMSLQNIHIANSSTLIKLSKVTDVVFGHSAFEQTGTFEINEIIIDPELESGEIITLIASVQKFMFNKYQIPHVFTELELHSESVNINTIEFNDIDREGWSVYLDNGVVYTMIRQHDIATLTSAVNREGSICFFNAQEIIGRVDFIHVPSPTWDKFITKMKELSVNVHVTGSFIGNREEMLVRSDFVEKIKSQGGSVAYVGDSFMDVPALVSSDVSIGLSQDEGGLLTQSICELMLEGDIIWLSRLITISRRFTTISSSNLYLITSSSLFFALLAATSIINPIQSILLLDMPLLIAQVRSVLGLRYHE